MSTIVEVILPVPIKSNFHYLVKPDQVPFIEIGKRVLVSFGQRKIYTGVIKDIFPLPEKQRAETYKVVEEILDEVPTLGPRQLSLFEWIAFYYHCTEGEVLKAALPAALKPESSLSIEATPDIDWRQLELDEKEQLLLENLSIQPVLSFKEIADIWNIANPNARLKAMEGRGLIRSYQSVQTRYKPKLKTFLALAETYQQEDKLREAFDSFGVKQESQETLLTYIVSEHYRGNTVPKKETLQKLTLGSHVVKSLMKKGIIEEQEVQVDRLELDDYLKHRKDITFNPQQQAALNDIHQYIQETPLKPMLLHGVTGSGKTYLYIELIKEVMAQGKQALYLLPEITLTKQIIERVKGELGEKVGIYHSKFNDNERVEIWRKVVRREYDVIVGVRSAVFLPFEDLGIIVVDEEHDQSFKQTEPAPRYNARDLAIYYGQRFNFPVILGSATPAFETYQNALQGKYHYISITKRAVAVKLPEIEIVDMRIQRKKRLQQGVFSSVLLEALQGVLSRGEQAILFQNRRGYAPYLICENCGHVPQCIHCDISLTYHKEKQQLRCHYCGYTHFQTQKCENCGHYALKDAGIGTEKIEDEVKLHFPNVQVQRMDLDTTRSKTGFQRIINRFEKKEIDILVGTQMVSKGLDFDNVTLVGVINADNLLSFPDFRAYEKAYQLITQVSGRAGRSHKEGRVIIQTLMPDNIVLKSISNPYSKFFKVELLNRQQLEYPPFTRLIRIEIRHKDKQFIETESLRLQKILYPHFGKRLLGPDFALVARVRNQYRMNFLIKLPKNFPVKRVRTILSDRIDHYFQVAPQKTLRIIVNIDPN